MHIIFAAVIYSFFFFASSALAADNAVVNVDASQVLNYFPRYEHEYYQSRKPRGPLDIANIKKIGVNYVDIWWYPVNWAPAEGQYQFSDPGIYWEGTTEYIDQVLQYAPVFSLVIERLPSWLAKTDMWSPPNDLVKYEQMVYDGLAYMKNRYPQQFRYFLVHDEVDLHGWSVEEYGAVYAAAQRAATRVNNELPAGIPKLKLAGPSSYSFTLGYSWMSSFIDYAYNNQLQVDVFTWNTYGSDLVSGQTVNPSSLKDQTVAIRALLDAKGLRPELSVTFNATYRGEEAWYFTAKNLATTATFVMQAYDSFMAGGQEHAKIWNLGSSGDDCPLVGEDHVNFADSGKITPLGNALTMRSMLKTARIYSSSDQLQSTGIGLGGLASKDPNTGAVTVLLYNHQPLSAQTFNTSVVLNNLPSVWSQSNIKVEGYVTDETRANLVYNYNDDKMAKVIDRVIGSRSSHTETVQMTPNNVMLLVFTPDQSAIPDTNLLLVLQPVSGAAISNPLYATDGYANNFDNYTTVSVGSQWIKYDLGEASAISNIKIWHYFADSRVYHDVIVQLSNDASFLSGVTTVFNNDTDNSSGQGVGQNSEYAESALGKDISFSPVTARYLRFWTNGSNSNTYNHYVEVQAFAGSSTDMTAPFAPVNVRVQ